MSTQDNNSLEALINALRIWPTVSTPVYVDSTGRLVQGNIPFSLPLAAGATDTNFAVMNIIGSSTLTANDIMHQTLVAGAGVTTWTKTGFIKVNVTDNAGNITSGDHYIQFGTLT